MATISLPKSPTFLGNFCKGVKIYYFSGEIIFGQLLQTFGYFFLVTLIGLRNRTPKSSAQIGFSRLLNCLNPGLKGLLVRRRRWCEKRVTDHRRELGCADQGQGWREGRGRVRRRVRSNRGQKVAQDSGSLDFGHIFTRSDKGQV